jgi:hypothetical protein
VSSLNEVKTIKASQLQKKRAPERRGPSLYKVLSQYINLESFDPNQPPDVDELKSGWLELTGRSDDEDGYWQRKAEMAVKAWEVRAWVVAGG